MAVDVCSSEISSLVSSPRISFSHYLNKTNTVPIVPSLFDFGFDFDFNFNFCIDNFTNLSSADEIFSNGKILPVEINKPLTPHKEIQQCKATAACENGSESPKKKKLIEFLRSEFDEEDLKPLPKSFWKYSRSNSLNCESFRSKNILWPLQFLSRSNSTGSSLNPKQTAVSKDHDQKQNLSKQPPVAINSRSLSYSSGHSYPYNSSTKIPVKKNLRSNSNGGGGGGVRISPVLNIPYSCIDKAGSVISLFGFGSLFCNGKSKKKKK